MDSIKIETIKSAIESANASWEASETPFTAMSKTERTLLLGYVPGPHDFTLQEAENVAKLNFQAFLARVEAVGYPASFDLRNVGGQNFITPVKNQGGCGSCVAFGAAATVEGTMRKAQNNPNLAADLSEAHLFYCHARSEGRLCSNGWWPENALNAFRDKGVVDEACYKYTAGDQNCTGLCSDWQNRLTKITAWHAITSTEEMKNWLSTKGPLVTCYTVYNDFFSYTSGIYKHVTGAAVGGHCVSCVGYNDAGKYWICKNSWGESFGEKGYFRIAYGECGIDYKMYAVDGLAPPAWIRSAKILGLWTINEDRNAWVYIDKVAGWRKLSPDNDNILLDMLAQAATAKAGNRRVDLRQENNVIKEIYVL